MTAKPAKSVQTSRIPRQSRRVTRWERFKKNKRGYISLWIFAILFGLSLFSEFIANDRPLLLRFDGKFYFPVFKNYSELTFGGEFDINTDYRDPYIINLIEQKGWMLSTPVRFNYNTINYALPSPAPSPPTRENLLGTDDRGRDVAARLLYGFRISVLFALALTITSSFIGITLGALQGYFGGTFDILFQRFIEVWAGMPSLFMLIILSSVVEPNFWWLLGITLLFGWMSLVSIVRAEFLRARNFEYVLAARAMGMSHSRIMFVHILPNAMTSALSYLPFILGGSITTLTSLDFLGFGLPSGSPSLGELLAQGKANLHAPWLGVSAFMILAVSLSLLVFTGEAVRDAFDPRKSP
ncbi:MAG: ABC transporter permease [Spirochaetaceae bacterium]|jgi:microcin C transport system permease protein|nr:ABC transporter permease [Spirochaetaceae bacterium]